MGDEFNSSESWAISVANALTEANLNVHWQAFSRAHPVTHEMAKAMRQAGCWLVHLGVESGNPRTLAGIRKNVTLDQVHEAASLYQKNGIKVVGLFMLFQAWEEEGRLVYEDAYQSLKTLRFARTLLRKKLFDTITCSPAMPYPGSILFDVATRHHLIPKEKFDTWNEWDHSWKSVMTLPSVTKFQFWRIKCTGIWMQTWALLFSRKLNFSAAIWRRGFGLISMPFLWLFQKLKQATSLST